MLFLSAIKLLINKVVFFKTSSIAILFDLRVLLLQTVRIENVQFLNLSALELYGLQQILVNYTESMNHFHSICLANLLSSVRVSIPVLCFCLSLQCQVNFEFDLEFAEMKCFDSAIQR